MSLESNLEREESILEEQLNNGEISSKEHSKLLQELYAEAREYERERS